MRNALIYTAAVAEFYRNSTDFFTFHEKIVGNGTLFTVNPSSLQIGKSMVANRPISYYNIV